MRRAPVRAVFSTPLLEEVRPRAGRVNAGLSRAILSRERRDPGLRVSNVGGWHSQPDLLNWPEPEVAVLKRWIRESMVPLLNLREGRPRGGRDVSLTAEAWAMVYRAGAWSRHHVHPRNHWSGIYCVSPGDANARDRGGEIVLHDPRPGAASLPLDGMGWGSEIVIQPRAALMLIFPSWIAHSVWPYRGRRPRITIAFNVTVAAKRRPG